MSVGYAQRRAEAGMLDYGKGLHPTGGYAYDEVDKVDKLATDDLFEAPYKIQTRNLVSRESDVGGRSSTTIRVELHLPAWTDALSVGDLWECVSPSPDSLEVVGTQWRVTGVAAGSLKTARRYEVEAVLT